MEMCEHFVKGDICPWGDMCNFAHHSSELSHQTLVQGHQAGLIDDIMKFRTRPCPDHVMTGSWYVLRLIVTS